MICPAVLPCRCASSLAACKTSSSMSKVVRMNLMLIHHCIKVKTSFYWLIIYCEAISRIAAKRFLLDSGATGVLDFESECSTNSSGNSFKNGDG
jgi:hypothetical protein